MASRRRQGQLVQQRGTEQLFVICSENKRESGLSSELLAHCKTQDLLIPYGSKVTLVNLMF